jgi:general secretion pathway protein G
MCMTRKENARRSRRSAFTLLEILIVMALIALLATLAITKFTGVLEEGEKQIAEQFVNQTMKLPLTNYRIHMRSYPTTAQGLQALLTAPDATSSNWKGPYLDTKGGKVPEDPWKHPYQYRYPGTKNPTGYDLFSWGPDGVESEDDIGNW